MMSHSRILLPVAPGSLEQCTVTLRDLSSSQCFTEQAHLCSVRQTDRVLPEPFGSADSQTCLFNFSSLHFAVKEALLCAGKLLMCS